MNASILATFASGKMSASILRSFASGKVSASITVILVGWAKRSETILIIFAYQAIIKVSTAEFISVMLTFIYFFRVFLTNQLSRTYSL